MKTLYRKLTIAQKAVLFVLAAIPMRR